MNAQRRALQVHKARNQLLMLLESNETLVLIGETGSGKTTQVPQLFMKHARKLGLQNAVSSSKY